MSLESNIADLNTATAGLLTAINTQKTVLNTAVASTTASASAATASASTASTQAGTASTQATLAERDGPRYWGLARHCRGVLFFWKAAHRESAYYTEARRLQEAEAYCGGVA